MNHRLTFKVTVDYADKVDKNQRDVVDVTSRMLQGIVDTVEHTEHGLTVNGTMVQEIRVESVDTKQAVFHNFFDESRKKPAGTELKYDIYVHNNEEETTVLHFTHVVGHVGDSVEAINILMRKYINEEADTFCDHWEELDYGLPITVNTTYELLEEWIEIVPSDE